MSISVWLAVRRAGSLLGKAENEDRNGKLVGYSIAWKCEKIMSVYVLLPAISPANFESGCLSFDTAD